jgi:hypothetical protein
MVRTDYARRTFAHVLPCMTDIIQNEQTITDAIAESDAAQTAAQPELRIGVGTLLGRLSAGEAA